MNLASKLIFLVATVLAGCGTKTDDDALVCDESTDKDDPSFRLRHKASLQLNTDSALTPDAFYEHFDDPNADKEQRAQQRRLGAGLAIKLGANHRFKLKAFQDTELDGDGDKERVLAAGYRYGF